MGLSIKNYKKLDLFSKDLLQNFVDKGFVISKSNEVVHKIGNLDDVVNNREFISIASFAINLQEIINQGINEAKENKPYIYQNIEIKQVRYNIVVLSLSFGRYFLVSFVKSIKSENNYLSFNKTRENNYNLTLNEVSNFLNNSMISAISINMEKDITNYTKDIENIFDFEDDVVGKNIVSLTPKFFNYPRVLTNITQVVQTGSTKTLHTKTKENTIYSVNIAPYYNNETNQQIGAVITFQDITTLKANENELIRKNEEIEEILNTLNMGMINCEVIKDETETPIDLKILYINNKISDFLKLDKKVLLGRTVKEVFPSIGDSLVETYGNVAITMTPHQQTYYLDVVKGYRNVHGMSINKGQVIITLLDVSEQMKAQKENEDKILRHGMILESAKTGFFEMNIKDKEMYLDQFCVSLYKEEIPYDTSREEFKRRLHYLDVDRVLELNNKVLNGEIDKANHIFRFLNIDTNEYSWIRQILIPAEKENGKAIRLLGLYSDINEQKLSDEKAEEMENLLKETNKVAHIARFIFNPIENTFGESLELCEFLGVDEVTSLQDFRKLVHEEDLAIYDQATEYIQQHPEGKVTKYRIVMNGKIRYIQSSVYGKRDEFGYVNQVFGLLKDITEIEESRLESELNRKSFELIFNSSPAGIFLLDEKFIITMVNDTFNTLLDTENNKGITLKQLLGNEYETIINILKTGKAVSSYKVEYTNNSIVRFLNINIVKIDKDFDNSYQGTLTDITREVEVTDQINYMANHDVLTNLYNRNYFESYIEKNSKVYPTGVMICDIDGLKVINDAFGHLNGDELLIAFAEILKKTFKNQMIARIGGDEFCIILQNTSVEDLDNYEKLIKSELNEVELYGMGFDVSIGSSLLKDKKTTFLEAFVIAENKMYKRKLTERSSRKSKTLDTIMSTLNEKTEETLEHCDRVADLSEALLKEVGFARQVDIQEIRLLSRIHDIGKITVSKEILSKPASLTKAEFDKVKQHSESGYKIVKSILDSENISLGVLYHHERIDGKGYPHNLKGDQIPVFAKIISITDAYDAMINYRSYKRQMSKEEAIKELKDNRGTQFDSDYVDKFIKLL